MPMLEIFMLGFLAVVAIVGVGWLIYESRSEDEKQLVIVSYETSLWCVFLNALFNILF